MSVPRLAALLAVVTLSPAVATEPGKLISLDGGIAPTYLDDGNDESSNEGSTGGKMGEVTILTESLKPLRDHFNANKHKHRFVALLSPT